MSNNTTNTETYTPAQGDPTRVTQQYLDTNMRLIGEMTTKDVQFFVPAALSAGGALLAEGQVRWALVAVGAVLSLVGAAAYTTDRWYTSPRERCQNLRAYLSAQRSLPWGHEESIENDVAGIRRVYQRSSDAGLVETTDGRIVAALRVGSRNTAMQTPSERDATATALGTAMDEIGQRGLDVQLFSTTRDPTPEAVTEAFAERAFDATTDQLADDPSVAGRIRDYLHDISAWHRESDAPSWEPREWQHYLLVDVEPWEVPGTGEGSWRQYLPWVDGGDSDETIDERMRQLARKKRRHVRDAIGIVDGVSTEHPSPEEIVDVLAEYWTGGLSSDGDSLAEMAADPEGAATLLAPGVFDVTRRHVEVDDSYARTYWLTDFPSEPEPLFLRELYTMRGVDLDVKVHCRQEEKRDAIADLEYDIAEVDAEGMEREDAGDVTATDVDDDLDGYLAMRELLRDTSAQPFQVTAYVTVRADSQAALDHAHEQVAEYDSVPMAQADALDEAATDVEMALEGTPAKSTAVLPGLRHREAFTSASPLGLDEYQLSTEVDKTSRVLGGAIGGLFPFCAIAPQEEGGLVWGRNEQQGGLVATDSFARGSAPHMLTIGQSRSGKTFSTEKAALRWYLEDDDHNLIVCDTQGGFHGSTQFADGKHLVVDGQKTVNPLDIQPIPEYKRETAGSMLNPYRLKVEEATQFFVGILRSQGVRNPGEYTSTIQTAIERAYTRADISAHDLDSHANPSPTVADFIDVLENMLEETDTFTYTDEDEEHQVRRDRASNLLERLSGFQEGGKYHHLVGETREGLLEPGTDMAYLDLQQLQGSSGAERSVMLHLMLSQVSQQIKRADGETMFVIDEAHMLLHSDEMVRWLQKAAREWARYDAAMWFVTQSPREFVQQSDTKEVGQENQRKTIVDQCSTMQFFRTPRVDDETLKQFDLNRHQREFIRDEATPGKSGRGYSECLLHLEDHEGWLPLMVEASPFEEYILTYEPHEHGEFEAYLDRYQENADIELGAAVDATHDSQSQSDETTVADGGERHE